MSTTQSKRETQYYEVRAFPNGKDKYQFFTENKVICLGWPDIGDIQLLPSENRQEKIKNLLSDKYTSMFSDKDSYLTQVSTFFTRFLDMEIGDIILIPYMKKSVVTIATVSSTYAYKNDTKCIKEHVAHQIGIKDPVDIDISDLSNSLSNRLRAQLTLTRIDEDKHEEIKNLYKNKKTSNKNLNACIYNICSVKNHFNRSITEMKSSKYTDELIAKSLLLSSFSLLEGFLSDIIENEIIHLTNQRENDDDLIIKLGINSIKSKKLSAYGWNSKLCLFNELFNLSNNNNHKKIEKVSTRQQSLRNFLAHDITSVSFSDDYTKVIVTNGKEIFVGDLFDILIDCAREIDKIINSNK